MLCHKSARFFLVGASTIAYEFSVERKRLRKKVEIQSMSVFSFASQRSNIVLRIAGERAESVLDRKLQNIRADLVQIDEAWTFVQKKQRSVRPDDDPEYGDQWAFLAITEHKLITAYALGKREA